jgi:dienelactone hydrolase
MNPVEKHKTVAIQIGNKVLQGYLNIPDNAIGLVLFSHGSGSSRNSPRNTYVASVLEQHGIATFLFDLLTEAEDSRYETRFDIDLLTERLIGTTDWVAKQPELQELPIGYFGASTGAASALKAAAHYGSKIHAVVSRGGRPDMALAELHKVIAPTLLLVGGWDHLVIKLNTQAYQKLKTQSKLKIIPEASHLFEEPGKLEDVAKISAKWFAKWLPYNKVKNV